MNLLSQLPQPVIFAHRGASAYAPENTLASFSLALKYGAPAIELDVKLTADQQVIVIHDQTVNRTTDGQGDVRNLSLRQVKELDAGIKKGEQFRGEPIPTLAEVFETVGKSLFINVELTNYATGSDSLVDEVVKLVRHYQLEERVMFSSFNPLNLRRARKLLPQTPVGMLAMEGGAGLLARGFVGRWASPKIIHPYLNDVDQGFMTHQKNLRRRVHVWTVNAPEDMRKVFELGVDGIFTDDPILALQILGKND